MSEFTKGVREMVTTLKGAIIARPNDPDGEPVGNIANLLEMCADKIEEAEQQLAAKDAEIATEQRLSFRNQVAGLERQIVMLRGAGQAVIDRWDTPLWKDVPATAEYINRLRNAVAAIDKELKWI